MSLVLFGNREAQGSKSCVFFSKKKFYCTEGVTKADASRASSVSR